MGCYNDIYEHVVSYIGIDFQQLRRNDTKLKMKGSPIPASKYTTVVSVTNTAQLPKQVASAIS